MAFHVTDVTRRTFASHYGWVGLKIPKNCTRPSTGGLWLGWAYLNKKVHRPWHQGVCLNLPMIFCA